MSGFAIKQIIYQKKLYYGFKAGSEVSFLVDIVNRQKEIGSSQFPFDLIDYLLFPQNDLWDGATKQIAF